MLLKPELLVREKDNESSFFFAIRSAKNGTILRFLCSQKSTTTMPPSTPEEIAAQHAEAICMVENGLPHAIRQELGPIPLEDKQQPTCNLYNEEEKKDESEASLKNPICFTTLGEVDVTLLQDMLREGFNIQHPTLSDDEETIKNKFPPLSPTDYWDPRNAAARNVSITRPSHDAWGIQKVALMFCDDFVTRIYQLPWFQEFEAALQPIFKACLPPNATLIRLLFASLPPGVTIPVHHDTGEWAKKAHRVHVPILVHDTSKVLFRVGPTTTTMQRIDCQPGHIFEINNMAKHAVSNCDSDSRVHLIMDYMDEPGPERIVLEAGERLVQTRRSIDRLKDIQKRPTPSYIILGAQKAGTTSLYDYINQHPWVMPARRRETHCFDWRWDETLTTTHDQLDHCRKFFFAKELEDHPSCLTGDSTPSYLLDSRRVIPRIQALITWKIKLFAILRDPVQRAISHYAMVTSMNGTPAQLKTRGSEWRKLSFRKVIDMELEKMDSCGLIPYWDKEQGVVDQTKWDAFAGSPEEDAAWDKYLANHVPLNNGSYGLLTRGMYAVQLRPWLRAFDRDQLLVLRLESLRRKEQGGVGVQEFMRPVWEHLDLPNHPVEDETAKNTRGYQPMGKEVQEYLQRFFEPHNRQLAQVLGVTDPQSEWIHPWPYAS